LPLSKPYTIKHGPIDINKFPEMKDIKRESVIKISGEVVKKPEPNPKLETGAIEVSVNKLEILSSAETLPIDIDNSINTSEDMRLKYRYLDIRTSKIKDNLILRSKVTQAVRKFLDKEGFIEIETPVLARSTPEGARDFLVPSRRKAGEFFALPQSPQLFKQILMVAGMDKYFQIAKCFRDEDLRSDRQLEFTQIDIEMSFVEQSDILEVNERMMKYIFKEVLDIDLEIPFKRMTYEEAMEKYGSDKPDLRFGIEMKDLTDVLKKTDFGIFQNAEFITGLKIDGDFSRKKIEAYTKFVQEHKQRV
jgi:aspartyl-tRNA synthetase